MIRSKLRIERIDFINHAGKSVSALETGQPAVIRINYLAHNRVENPIFGLAIHRNDGTHINGPNTDTADFTIDCIEGRGTVEYQINFLPLLGGSYSVTAGVFDKTHTITYDYRERNFHFTVKQNAIKEMYGVVYVPSNWRHIPE